MTQTPPVTPEDPVDGGQGAPPTPTDQSAQQTEQEVATQTPLLYADHRTYANALYEQPVWVIDAVFASGYLQPPTDAFTQAQVQSAIESMMAVTDNQFADTTTEAQ